MATDDIERLHYYQRQYLGAQDFEDQQAYHRDMRRRHNLAHHTWGIVTGLELKQITKTGTNAVDIYITPGMAIDGYGREIVVLQPTQLDPTHFLLFRDQQVRTVCLEYLENFAQSPQQGYQQCDVANQFGRVQESFNVVVADPNPPFRDDLIVDGKAVFPQLPVPSFSGPNPEDAPIMPLSSPPSQLSNDLIIPFDESIPYQEFPTDDPSALIIARWLIPLGKVIWNGTPGNQQFMQDTATPPFLTEGRHYIGTIASRIFAPAGKLIVRDRNTVLPFKSSTQLQQPAKNGSQSPPNTKTSQTTTNTTSNTNITGTTVGNINVASTSNSTSSTSTPNASAGGPPASSNTPQAATGASPADTSTSSDGVAMIIEGTLEVDRVLQVHGPLQVDGTLQVDGIVTARNNIQLWGGQLDFRDTAGTSDGKSSTDPLFTISRQGTDTTTGISLRATIGKDSNGKNRFVVGPVGTEQFWITDDGNAHLTGSMDGLSITGTLSFGSQPRQMIQLWSSKDQSQQNGIGVQVASSSATTYFRSSNDFCWFKGGIHNDTPDSPGGGGKLQLKLDQDGSLHFDQDSDANQRWRQMLNLSSTKYGIGVQDSTLYFRSDFDFCWFRNGSHANERGNASNTGSLQMKLDNNGLLEVHGGHSGYITYISSDTINNIPISVAIGKFSGPHSADSIYGTPNLWLDADNAVIAKQGFRISGRNGAAFFPSGTPSPNPGDVVVLNSDGSVSPARTANNPLVIGVALAPTAPGFILANQPLQQDGTLVALIGVVDCKVAPGSTIAIGDLLTTSDSPNDGCAQKADTTIELILQSLPVFPVQIQLVSPTPRGAIFGKAVGQIHMVQNQAFIPVLLMPN